MPLYVPTAKEELAKAIWEYTTRLVTSLATPDDIVKFLGKGTGSEVPANKSLYDLIALDRLDNAIYGLSALRARILERALESGGRLQNVETDINNIEIPIRFPTSIAQDDIAATGNQYTTELTVPVSFPTGGSIVRVSLITLLTLMNDTANTQKITITIQGRKGAGSWSNLWVSTIVVTGMPNVDASPTGFPADIDITALVDAAATYGFRLLVTQSSANSVHYTTNFVVELTYRMS